MNLEEAKEMQGTEFTYIYKDGDTVPAYIKKFDPEVGMTCMTMATETRDGWSPDSDLEEDGTWCIMGYPTNTEEDMQECLEVMQEIKETGTRTSSNTSGFGFIGCVFS